MSNQIVLSSEEISSLQRQLLLWFESNQRDFPWRHTRNPYIVLIAEKLLQQTAARDSVIEAFLTLATRYPTPVALSEAGIEDLEEVFFPLGFHYRAQELKRLGAALVQQFAGVVPKNEKELKELPGVGEYAARAVMSFCYGEDVSIVDTNVARFLYRLFGIPGAIPSNPARKKWLIELASALIPAGQSREFNLAILDLCALVCLPKDPKCTICPVRQYCSYGSSYEW